jgi:hypothetical protein
MPKFKRTLTFMDAADKLMEGLTIISLLIYAEIKDRMKGRKSRSSYVGM